VHDSQVEEHLRSTLRAAGDSLPLTITEAELVRRLAVRRRATAGRRLSLMAAAVAMIAIGSIVAVGNDWLRLPALGIGPAPSTSPAPSSLPVASPIVSPPSGRAPLGNPDEAILVRPLGTSWTTPDAFEVRRTNPADGTSTVIATIPGSVLPAGSRVSTSGNRPVVSATGWLAIPTSPSAGAVDTGSFVVIVDVTDPDAEPWLVEGFASGSWNAADELAMIGESGVSISNPATRLVAAAPPTAQDVSVATLGGAANDPVWTTESVTPFLARRLPGGLPPAVWGVVDAAGTFRERADLPPLDQRTGRERPMGADGHTLAMSCIGSGTPEEAGCALVEADATGQTVGTRVATDSIAGLRDHAWVADGRSAWLVFDRDQEGGHTASILLSPPSGGTVERARVDVPAGDTATILGIGRGWLVVGTDNGWVRAFARVDGSADDGSVSMQEATSWFAGWAGVQPAYDPD
jgi:hypothetical protein